MSKKMIGFFIGGIFCLALFMYADKLPKSAIAGVENVYYGHISFTEVKHDGKDPVVIRDGEPNEEVAVLNLPLTAGDTILTPEGRRCEIQFDTGTILRLDVNTELRLETLLADSLSSSQKMTNLMLYRGQVYVMYKRYTGREVFQVKTPKAAVKLDHNCVALIHARDDSKTDVRVLEGKAYVMFGAEDLLDFTKAKVGKEQQLIITADDHLITNDYQNDDADFMAWNLDLNENFVEMHEGKTYIPMLIQKYPESVFYFAQKYANLYGEWIYDRMYGYVWRPFFNDSYPNGTWQPYYYGYWRRLEGQLFWVPAEPWGWVPYHLGLWQWDIKHGWLWIPGDAFAPAWAVWDFYHGYYTWRPWLIWDWAYFGQEGYHGIAWLMYHYLLPYAWSGFSRGWVGPWYPSSSQTKVLYSISKDQLKKPAASPYKIPDKMRNASKNAQKALEQGDKRALESIRAVPSQMVFVKGKDLDRADISERALRSKDITRPAKGWNGDLKPISDPFQAAVKAHWDAAGAAALRQYMFGDQESTRHTPEHFNARETSEKAGEARSFNRETGRNAPSASVPERTFKGEVITPRTFGLRNSGMKVRDWNPDIKFARMAGVSIVYSSKSNEITCPELRLTSRSVSKSRSLVNRGTSSTISRGLSTFLSSSGGSSGGSGSSVSSSHGSIGASSRGFASAGGGTRGGSGSKK